MLDLSTIIVLVLGSGLGILAYTFHRNRSTTLPPGPTALPLLGNVLNFPKSLDPQVFYELTQKHGEQLSQTRTMCRTELCLYRRYRSSERPWAANDHIRLVFNRLRVAAHAFREQLR